MDDVEQQIRRWLEQVVIGLNLCPFARGPFQNGTIRIVVSRATDDQALLEELRAEFVRLDETPADSLETTLLVVTQLLADFDAYNQFLDEVDFVLRRGGWTGQYQIATFHPLYRFHGTDLEDPSNLTNRSPWPILHILRESSIDRALAGEIDTAGIPERNIQRMAGLTTAERRRLFPWLSDVSARDRSAE